MNEPRTARELLAATRPFAQENRARSWWCLGSTLTILLGLLAIAGIAPWWPLRLAAALMGSLVMVRGFILFHDFAHGAILRRSKSAKVILYIYGMLFMVGPKYWRQTHNHHHANVSTIKDSAIGSFPIMTVEDWRNASPMKRFHYRLARHPLTIFFAYITVFFFSNSLEPFVRNPLRHWASGVAVLSHAGLIALLWWLGGPLTAFFVLMLPYGIAAMLGAYLFYAQHNFKGMYILPIGKWSQTEASLRSTSYMKLNPIMAWCTGQIGYHHIHHLNPTIPFYRLREAMDNIPELQNPVITTLRPHDVLACLRLKLWDEQREEMISFRQAKHTA